MTVYSVAAFDRSTIGHSFTGSLPTKKKGESTVSHSMLNHLKRVLVPVLATAAILAIITGSSALAGSRNRSTDEQHLEGSWMVTASVPGVPEDIRGLATFTRDGGVVETTAEPHVTTAHGAWLRTGNREFVVTVWYFRLDETGQFIGSARGRSTFTLNKTGNAASSKFQLDAFDANDQLISSDQGTATATRIAAGEPSN